MPNTKSAIRRTRRVKIQTTVNKIRKSKFKFIIKRMNSVGYKISDVRISSESLLSKDYAKKRFQEIDRSKSNYNYRRGNFKQHGDTVYISVIDGEGNSCSLINSLYQGFGTGLVVPGTGIALQNRGALFSLNKEHPNLFQPSKRPYNTIIPGMLTKEGKLFSCMGVMGGFQQPQGHLQVVSNMIDYNIIVAISTTFP